MLNIGEGFSYATVWQPVMEERRMKCNLTTSKKLKEPIDGKEYENSNWSNAVFVGKAFTMAGDLVEKDRIKILSGTVDNKPYVGADGVRKYFNNVVISDFEKMASNNEIAGAANTTVKQQPATTFASLSDDEMDSDLPF